MGLILGVAGSTAGNDVDPVKVSSMARQLAAAESEVANHEKALKSNQKELQEAEQAADEATQGLENERAAFTLKAEESERLLNEANARAETAEAEALAAQSDAPAPAPPVAETPDAPTPSTYYENCTAVRSAGAAPIHAGDPGYGSHLDRDGDGVGCE